MSHGELGRRTLALHVFDYDRLSQDDLIGCVLYPLKQMEAEGGQQELWRDLQAASSDVDQLYSVSQKNPPCGFLTFSPNGWEFFNQFLHTYYAFFSTLDDEFLFNYLQL